MKSAFPCVMLFVGLVLFRAGVPVAGRELTLERKGGRLRVFSEKGRRPSS